jgi:hypothetical protein
MYRTLASLASFCPIVIFHFQGWAARDSNLLTLGRDIFWPIMLLDIYRVKSDLSSEP